ncbi:glycosyltransferase family 4 protein [Parapedobacter indicus]|uniref:Glycosyltransferase involved in cell wall bisynthesis n=1 Tax=Parapedobacter indicus TaxID=1477437 RepID=A0A1I3UTK0_9SPHI|nr:glycosyltransferase family 4 protein [Parapedobacter indicus]PPK99091.1 glycosyltransferase involved in cell wall biosynthesis [Parapedobacter indicus]SFJ86262.1 Glycosyltransferase involved in cell wall bisynthesis [Parapedobacter indicus]
MRIAYISTCQPRECGLATFNENLVHAVDQHISFSEHGSFIVALNDSDDKRQYAYDDSVKFVISQERLSDYQSAAAFINSNGVDMCCIQHEFGIYGGRNGVYLLGLTRLLKVPYTVIFHTVLAQPNPIQLSIVKRLADRAAAVVVMTKKAVQLLRAVYDISTNKIKAIPHGVPDFDKPDAVTLKTNLGLPAEKILLTFGLIGPSKGLETTIKSLPAICKRHPDVRYVILGKTHPGILRSFGEDYRTSLMQLAEKLGVADHLIFISEFVHERKLHSYLSACDLYITPYPNEAQITSGTLSYAIGAGAAVVSTPYWHAAELLKNNRGKLFDFNNDQQLSSIINELLSNPAELKSLKRNAYKYGLSLRWPKIGKQYAQLFKTHIKTEEKPSLPEQALMQVTSSFSRTLTWKTSV